MTKLLVIVPCYNEAQNIESLIQELQQNLLTLKDVKSSILVVDDGSKDDSFSRASKLVPTVRLPANLGIGGAVQTGIKYAQRHNFDLALQVDGDGQHPPSQIPLLIERWRETKANLVIGSRFLDKEGFQSTRPRRWGIGIIRFFLSNVTKEKITDPTSGFRLMDQKCIEIFSRDYPSDFPEPISIAIVKDFNLKISEQSVTMREREFGSSSIAGLKNLSYMVRVSAALVLVRLRKLV